MVSFMLCCTVRLLRTTTNPKIIMVARIIIATTTPIMTGIFEDSEIDTWADFCPDCWASGVLVMRGSVCAVYKKYLHLEMTKCSLILSLQWNIHPKLKQKCKHFSTSRPIWALEFIRWLKCEEETRKISFASFFNFSRNLRTHASIFFTRLLILVETYALMLVYSLHTFLILVETYAPMLVYSLHAF